MARYMSSKGCCGNKGTTKPMPVGTKKTGMHHKSDRMMSEKRKNISGTVRPGELGYMA